MTEPAPAAVLVSLGEKGPQLELRVHVRHVDLAGPVQHDLLRAIEGELRREGIPLA